MKKDIILILSGGGMMGIFTAGVLKTLDKDIRKRVHSIYGTSSGADVGAYFISDQMDIPFTFFTKYLTKIKFIRKNLILYIIKILFFKDNKQIKVKDYINVDYVVTAAKETKCKIDLKKFKQSQINFFVKAINMQNNKTEYLPTKKDLFNKLEATSQTGPFSSKAIKVGKDYYIDGGTLPSKIDIKLAQDFKDKKIIYIESSYSTKVSKILLYPFYLLAGCMIMRIYGKPLGKRYIKNIFVNNRKDLKKHRNVICIKNKMNNSAFCTNIKKLEKIYEHGMNEAGFLLTQNKI